MYFENFKRVYYDFPIKGDNRDTTLVKVSDITRNVRFKTEFIRKLSVFETYKMEDHETIEIVSERVYGTPDYHWILMILNERYDYIEDFPLSGVHFHKYMQRKYGDRQDDTRFFIDTNGAVTNGYAVIKIADEYDAATYQYLIQDKIQVGSIVRRKTSIGNYTARVESVNREEGELTIMITAGNILKNDTITIWNWSADKSGNFTEQLLGTSKVLSASVQPGYTAVSNYEYEYARNEDKRIIKIVPAGYMSQILNEFSEILG